MVLQMARRGKPYHVREFEFKDFYDLHHLGKAIKADDVSRDVENMPVHWMKLKSIKAKKGVPNEIEVKESYSEPYRRVILGQTRQTRKRTKRDCSVDLSLLKPAYEKQIPISRAKKADLVKLCTTGVVPTKYHEFYNSLATSDVARDCLPQPDATEANCETESPDVE
jgi:hypothetical protein